MPEKELVEDKLSYMIHCYITTLKTIKYYTNLKNIDSALAGVAQWIEHRPVN